MGLGDSNYREGGKKSRFDFEFKALTALQTIRDLLVVLTGNSGKVKNSTNDTTSNFLSNKLTVTSGVLDKTTNTPGGNETLNLTISALGVATGMIADDAVTYAKLQNISTNQRVLGRNTASAGNAEELTITQVLDWLGSTQGQIAYRGATTWEVLNPGISGQVLRTNGGATNPSWANTLQYVSLASNVTTTSTTLANISGMSFAVAANAEYYVEFSSRNGCTSANGSRFGISVPTGTTTGINIVGSSSTTNAQAMSGLSLSGSGEIAQTLNQANSTAGSTYIRMKVKTGGSSGNFNLQIKSITSGDTTTIYADATVMSYIRLS